MGISTRRLPHATRTLRLGQDGSMVQSIYQAFSCEGGLCAGARWQFRSTELSRKQTSEELYGDATAWMPGTAAANAWQHKANGDRCPWGDPYLSSGVTCILGCPQKQWLQILLTQRWWPRQLHWKWLWWPNFQKYVGIRKTSPRGTGAPTLGYCPAWDEPVSSP